MSTSNLELLSVTARLFPVGSALTQDAEDQITEEHVLWYCSAGNELSDANVICPETGQVQADIVLFNFDYPTSCAYAEEVWNDFSFLEYGNRDVLECVLEELAIIAKALLNRQKSKYPVLSVRFLVAWELVTTEAGWVGLEYYQEQETETCLIGWANLTKEGLTIVTVEELIEESKKPFPDSIPDRNNNIPF